MTLLLLVSLTIVALLVYKEVNKKRKQNNTTVTVKTFKTTIGWGYEIDIEGKACIYQPFIPVIENHTGFESKEIAEKAGKIVVDKILNHLNPTLTLNDLRLAGVMISEKVKAEDKLTN